MSVLERLLSKLARFAEVLEGMDDPIGDSIVSLGSASKSSNATWSISKAD